MPHNINKQNPSKQAVPHSLNRGITKGRLSVPRTQKILRNRLYQSNQISHQNQDNYEAISPNSPINILYRRMEEVVKKKSGSDSDLSQDIKNILLKNAQYLSSPEFNITTVEQLDELTRKLFVHDSLLMMISLLFTEIPNGVANYKAFENPSGFDFGPININDNTSASSSALQYTSFLITVDYLSGMIGDGLKNNRYCVHNPREILKKHFPEWKENWLRNIISYADQNPNLKHVARPIFASMMPLNDAGYVLTGKDSTARKVDNGIDSFLGIALKSPEQLKNLYETLVKPAPDSLFAASFYLLDEAQIKKSVLAVTDTEKKSWPQATASFLAKFVSGSVHSLLTKLSPQAAVGLLYYITITLLFNAMKGLDENGTIFGPGTKSIQERNDLHMQLSIPGNYGQVTTTDPNSSHNFTNQYPLGVWVVNRIFVSAFFSIVTHMATPLAKTTDTVTKVIMKTGVNATKFVAKSSMSLAGKLGNSVMKGVNKLTGRNNNNSRSNGGGEV